jgi:NAD(P)H-nitrite reductase large subunit
LGELIPSLKLLDFPRKLPAICGPGKAFPLTLLILGSAIANFINRKLPRDQTIPYPKEREIFMADDLLNQGAIVQRDKETYAIAPHIPGGIITDFNLLRRLADVAEKYGVKAVKLTSAERFALVGLAPGDLDQVWQELGLTPGAAIGLCVRSIKICPGTTFCRLGVQDAVGVGLHLDEKYHGMPLPYKFKIGVSGCPNNCSEASAKDLGLVGTAKGWRVLAGGFLSGFNPRLADVIAMNLNDDEALALAAKVLDWFKEAGKKRRLGKIIEEIGVAQFQKELGLPVNE